MRTLVPLILFAAACRPHDATTPAPVPPRSPITLTYLGVAGWQLDSGDTTILTDPYFSRPADLDGPMVSDPAAVAAHAPAKAALIVIGHSHVDHLLDAPAVAQRTGATLLGSASTVNVGRASGLPDTQLIAVRGGEDYAFDGYSVRVIPSLHSAIGDKHLFGAPIAPGPTLPMRFDDYGEGGTFAYLVRIGGHQVLFLSTANFIEREVDGLRPDVAVVATGLREHVFDYTCRLMRALGHPPLVYANHFDDWQHAPVDEAPDDDLQAFIAEVHGCSPQTKVVIPSHFAPMVVR